MILVTFATPQENPFPLRLERGKAISYAGMLLLLVGVGTRAAERLAGVLAERHALRRVIEFGGAAGIYQAPVGVYYTVAHLFDRNGNGTGTLPALPGIAPAAALCDEAMYRGGSFPWVSAVGLPLLYTMETAVLHTVCRRYGVPLQSLRLVTDDGRGDIRHRYEQVLAEHRAETADLLLNLGEVL